MTRVARRRKIRKKGENRGGIVSWPELDRGKILVANMPTFLIIGAARSGTTALYMYMKKHPDVFMSENKETNFFAYENR